MPDAASVALLSAAARVSRLRGRLQRAASTPVELVETHISWLLLADATAYKIKKPIALPFLDFTRLEARRHFCEEELRLNRRLAGPIYLGLARITGTPDDPAIDGSGPVIDYAVRMRRFPAGALLADHAIAGTLRAVDIDRLADRLARFHAEAPRADPASGFGSAERRAAVALDALAAIEALAVGRGDECRALRGWLGGEAARLAPLWRARQSAGRVREGHGDLHLANLLREGDEVTAFDAIEFDPALRWIDIVDDAAFVAMDLHAHGRCDLASRFVNAWVEAVGDHDGLPLWRYAMVARALVRAQVGWIREGQACAGRGPGARAYLDLALGLAADRPAEARLLITHGLPGSGKSFLTQQLLERSGAIRLRSDVERKRLAGLAALADTRSLRPAADLYGAEFGRRTFDRLAALATASLHAGWPTIVDAAFLRRAERERFAALADDLKLPFAILDCRAPIALLRQRVIARQAAGGDPSEADAAVLDKLAAVAEPLTESERSRSIAVDTSAAPDPAALAQAWRTAGATGPN